MTRLPESSLWEEEIELISRSERVSGGLDGVANRPLKSLANRTRYLKEKSEASDGLIAEKVSAVKTFAEGATLGSPRDEILFGTYRLVWTGVFPKTVPANSTPQGTGGIGAGGWAYTSDAVIRRDLSSADVGVAYVDYVHLANGPVVTMEYFIATNLTPNDAYATMNDAFAAACASGKTVLLRSDVTYQVSRNDFPVARGTNLIATGGSYATIEVLSPFGDYGLFDMSTENGLNGGRYNIFYGLKFRYPNQVRIIDGTVIVKPVEYPPVFHGGAFESRFINLDMGNAYMAFRLGGAMNGRDLGSASRVVIDNIIGSPIYRGLSLEQVRDVPVIQNIRWNYNYLDGSAYAYDDTLKQWMHDNTWPWIFGRIDWAIIKNIFSYGCLRGITTLSSRYTGSADRLKFIGCHFDHTVFPLYLQNFSSRIDFSLCHFVGDKDSKFTRIAPNVCFINNVGDVNALVSFDECTFYNFTSTVLRTDGTRIELIGGSISKFGFDSQADRVRNGIELLSPTTIKIVGTRIDGSSGTHTRCVFDGGQGNSTLHIGDGSELTGATYESYRWDGGVTGGNKEYISREAVIEGATTAVNARGVHSFYQQK
ncbi:tail fiber/spike domain-containing protein, partial [Klebsiella michiganensis]